MADAKPLLTIGVPVYNGAKYLRQALDSLLAQSYENFELMISDNASTDQTGDICRSYAAKDERVRYYRNLLTVPINDNFHRVLTLASSDYFMWAACDDCWSFNMGGCVNVEANVCRMTCGVTLTRPARLRAVLKMFWMER
jgi:glycosyltransferase involved in cell wall biosynthesis